MPTTTSRRGFLSLAGATAGLALARATGDPRGAEANLDQDEFLENGAGKFKLDIRGCPVASANVESIAVEDLTIDVRETTTGADWDFRTYAPGDAHFGSVTVTFRDGAVCAELRQWLDDAAAGKNIRKSISVICLKRDGSEARRWNFHECFPVKLASAADAVRCKGAPVPLAVVVRPQRVELVPATPEEPEPGPPGGCGGRSLPPGLAQRFLRQGHPWAVQVSDAGTGETSSWSGLSDFVPTLPVVLDLTAAGNVPGPGTKYIDEITLRGPMTAQRRAWIGPSISEVVVHRPRRLNVTIVEIMKDGSDGKRYDYFECFPTRYVFPHLSADGTGNLYEEVSLKPVRLELA